MRSRYLNNNKKENKMKMYMVFESEYFDVNDPTSFNVDDIAEPEVYANKNDAVEEIKTSENKTFVLEVEVTGVHYMHKSAKFKKL